MCRITEGRSRFKSSPVAKRFRTVMRNAGWCNTVVSSDLEQHLPSCVHKDSGVSGQARQQQWERAVGCNCLWKENLFVILPCVVILHALGMPLSVLHLSPLRTLAHKPRISQLPRLTGYFLSWVTAMPTARLRSEDKPWQLLGNTNRRKVWGFFPGSN